MVTRKNSNFVFIEKLKKNNFFKGEKVEEEESCDGKKNANRERGIAAKIDPFCYFFNYFSNCMHQ